MSTFATDIFAAMPTDELVDRIGVLKAQIAALEATYTKAADQLKTRGRGLMPGKLYDANVFEQERDTLDMKAVRAKLSRQFIQANTRTSTAVVLKVTAKQLAVAA